MSWTAERSEPVHPLPAPSTVAGRGQVLGGHCLATHRGRGQGGRGQITEGGRPARCRSRADRVSAAVPPAWLRACRSALPAPRPVRSRRSVPRDRLARPRARQYAAADPRLSPGVAPGLPPRRGAQPQAQPLTRWCSLLACPFPARGSPLPGHHVSRPGRTPHPGNTGRIRPPDPTPGSGLPRLRMCQRGAGPALNIRWPFPARGGLPPEGGFWPSSPARGPDSIEL